MQGLRGMAWLLVLQVVFASLLMPLLFRLLV